MGLFWGCKGLGVLSECMFFSKIPALWLHYEVWRCPSEISVLWRRWSFDLGRCNAFVHDFLGAQYCSHVSCIQSKVPDFKFINFSHKSRALQWSWSPTRHRFIQRGLIFPDESHPSFQSHKERCGGLYKHLVTFWMHLRNRLTMHEVNESMSPKMIITQKYRTFSGRYSEHFY